jgi:acyl carrier protein
MGLDTVELIVEIEKRFDISIPDKDAENIATIGQLADYVHTHQKPGYKIEKKEIDQITIHLVSTLIGIPKEEIMLYHSFTNDLGMD